MLTTNDVFTTLLSFYTAKYFGYAAKPVFKTETVNGTTRLAFQFERDPADILNDIERSAFETTEVYRRQIQTIWPKYSPGCKLTLSADGQSVTMEDETYEYGRWYTQTNTLTRGSPLVDKLPKDTIFALKTDEELFDIIVHMHARIVEIGDYLKQCKKMLDIVIKNLNDRFLAAMSETVKIEKEKNDNRH